MKYFLFLVKKTFRVAFSQGPLAALQKITTFSAQKLSKNTTEWDNAAYKSWIKTTEPSLFSPVKDYSFKPKISVLVPVYNADIECLKKCFESVVAQTYDNWEICAVDDNSTKNKAAIKTIFEEYSGKLGDKFNYELADENGHISINTNRCARLATGEYFQILDNDDTLSPHAFQEYVEFLNTTKGVDILYGDEDYIDSEDVRSQPFFRPEFQPDYLLSTMYFPHFLASKELFNKLEGYRKGYEGAQDWDFALRAYRTGATIKHISKILYHWRSSETSTAGMLENKPYVMEALKKSISSYVESNSINAEVQEGIWNGSFLLKYKTNQPLVSIIIPNKNNTELLKKCINSIRSRSSYQNYEVIIVENGSTDADLFAYYRSLESHNKARVIKYKGKFNYSKVNNLGVKESKGDLILFLNNDVELLEADSIQWMVENALREDIGAVGAKLLYPDNTIQHAGVAFKKNKQNKLLPEHQFLGLNKASHGGSGAPLNTPRNPEAVTAACLMVEKRKFMQVGEFDEEYIIAYQDIDLCLKLNKHGFRSLYHPKSVWKHYESITRKTDSIDDNKTGDYEIFLRKNSDLIS